MIHERLKRALSKELPLTFVNRVYFGLFKRVREFVIWVFGLDAVLSNTESFVVSKNPRSSRLIPFSRTLCYLANGIRFGVLRGFIEVRSVENHSSGFVCIIVHNGLLFLCYVGDFVYSTVWRFEGSVVQLTS